MNNIKFIFLTAIIGVLSALATLQIDRNFANKVQKSEKEKPIAQQEIEVLKKELAELHKKIQENNKSEPEQPHIQAHSSSGALDNPKVLYEKLYEQQKKMLELLSERPEKQKNPPITHDDQLQKNVKTSDIIQNAVKKVDDILKNKDDKYWTEDREAVLTEINQLFDINGLKKEENNSLKDAIQKLNGRKVKFIISKALQIDQRDAINLIQDLRKKIRRLSQQDRMLLDSIQNSIQRVSGQ